MRCCWLMYRQTPLERLDVQKSSNCRLMLRHQDREEMIVVNEDVRTQKDVGWEGGGGKERP